MPLRKNLFLNSRGKSNLIVSKTALLSLRQHEKNELGFKLECNCSYNYSHVTRWVVGFLSIIKSLHIFYTICMYACMHICPQKYTSVMHTETNHQAHILIVLFFPFKHYLLLFSVSWHSVITLLITIYKRTHCFLCNFHIQNLLHLIDVTYCIGTTPCTVSWPSNTVDGLNMWGMTSSWNSIFQRVHAAYIFRNDVSHCCLIKIQHIHLFTLIHLIIMTNHDC